MKTIQILCGCLILLAAGCSKEKEEPIGGRAKSHHFMEVIFVDQAGDYLLNNIVPTPTDDKFIVIDKSLYTMRQFANGIGIDNPIPGWDNILIGNLKYGTICFDCVTPADYKVPAELQGNEAIWVYELKLSFPKLFGDEKEHTLTVLRKNINNGYLNNLEHLLFDGKVIVSNSDWDPVTIVVPTAQ